MNHVNAISEFVKSHLWLHMIRKRNYNGCHPIILDVCDICDVLNNENFGDSGSLDNGDTVTKLGRENEAVNRVVEQLILVTVC